MIKSKDSLLLPITRNAPPNYPDGVIRKPKY
jgi:hypothetical protein